MLNQISRIPKIETPALNQQTQHFLLSILFFLMSSLFSPNLFFLTNRNINISVENFYRNINISIFPSHLKSRMCLNIESLFQIDCLPVEEKRWV